MSLESSPPIFNTCGQCYWWRRYPTPPAKEGQPSLPVKGGCRLNPPQLMAVAIPSQHPITGQMNIQIQSIQSLPSMGVDEEACASWRPGVQIALG